MILLCCKCFSIHFTYVLFTLMWLENLPCVSGNECEEGKSDYNDQQRAFTSDCTYLMELRGKVMGRQRTILAASPEKMHAPLEIDKELYMESYYDTASLLYVLKNRVLDEVGYNYSGIRVQLRQEQEEAQKQSPRMDEMTL